MKILTITIFISLLAFSLNAQSDNNTEKKIAKAFLAVSDSTEYNINLEIATTDNEQAKASMSQACGFYMNL
jgi:hypothetical protein